MTNEKKSDAVVRFERPIKVDDVMLLGDQPIIIDSIETATTFSQRAGVVHYSLVRPDGSVVPTNRGELRPRAAACGDVVAISDMEMADALSFLDVEDVQRLVIMPKNMDGVKFTKALEVEERVAGEERHPSYGIIRITRPSGHATLFGSELNHQHFMTLSIHRASRRRDHHRDWIHGDADCLARVHLSEVQWARMVSSAGHGEGTPCTIDRLLGNDQGRPPDQNRLRLHDGEAGKAAKAATDMMASLVKQLEAVVGPGKTPSKTELKELLSHAKHVAGNIKPNLDFAVKAAQEAVETVVEEGKAEIEAFIDHQARKLGMDQLQGAPSLLLSAPKVEKVEKVVDAPQLSKSER